jgi:hypothetical protein
MGSFRPMGPHESPPLDLDALFDGGGGCRLPQGQRPRLDRPD